MKYPLVTVLMPVYNAEKFLSASIDSILEQSFKDFELLIINDGSKDKTEKIIKSFSDTRIRYVLNDQNMGMADTLNLGIQLAKGKYIARMDADDISLPERLKKQVTFMESHPDHGMVGTLYANMTDAGKIYEIAAMVQDNEEINPGLVTLCTFCHGSVMFRKSVLIQNNLEYRKEFDPFDDYELWTRIRTVTKLANIPEVLYLYRINPVGMTFSDPEKSLGGAIAYGKLIDKKETMPDLTFKDYLRYFHKRKQYSLKTICVNGVCLPSNFMLAYQTFLYKQGVRYLRRKREEFIFLFTLSFILNPFNWVKKLFTLV